MFQFSHRVTNYIFRLLIYFEIPSSEKLESCWETSSAHTWQTSIVSKPTRIPNPQLLLSHIHTNITWCLSHHWMFVADSTEDLCSFRQWGNVGLPLCILCLAPIFPADFPTPSSFPLICCCSSSWDLFAQTFSVPVSPYLAGSCTTYNAHYVLCWLPTSLWKPAPGCQWCLLSFDSEDLFPILFTALAS